MKKLALLVIILCLTACSHNSTPEMTPDPSLPEVTPVANPSFPATIVTRDVPKDEVQFDWDEAMRNIYICGRKIRFPKNAEDLLTQLGKGFSVKVIAETPWYAQYTKNADKNYHLALFYNGDEVPVRITCDTEYKRNPSTKDLMTKEPTKKSKIVGLSFSLGTFSDKSFEIVVPTQEFVGTGIYGFWFGAIKQKEDLFQFWGMPTEPIKDTAKTTRTYAYKFLRKQPLLPPDTTLGSIYFLFDAEIQRVKKIDIYKYPGYHPSQGGTPS